MSSSIPSHNPLVGAIVAITVIGLLAVGLFYALWVMRRKLDEALPNALDRSPPGRMLGIYPHGKCRLIMRSWKTTWYWTNGRYSDVRVGIRNGDIAGVRRIQRTAYLWASACCARPSSLSSAYRRDTLEIGAAIVTFRNQIIPLRNKHFCELSTSS